MDSEAAWKAPWQHQRQLYRAVKDSYGEMAATIELDQAEGKSFACHIANIYKMLAALLGVSNGFRLAMQAAVANSEDCTLSGCLYLDEAEPGNPLAPGNATKTWNFYVSFLEFPQHMLLMEEGRLRIASIRTNVVKKVNGHIAGVAKHLLNYLIFEIDTHNCLLYTSPSPRDQRGSRMPSSA